jgi:hypothetical protein
MEQKTACGRSFIDLKTTQGTENYPELSKWEGTSIGFDNFQMKLLGDTATDRLKATCFNGYRLLPGGWGFDSMQSKGLIIKRRL